MSTGKPIQSRVAVLRTVLAIVLTGLLATVGGTAAGEARSAGSQAPAPAYAWPVKPFHRQHPVRGFFGDPRVGRADDGTMSRQFHFGIDVSAPNGTRVYATLSGTVTVHPRHPDVLLIVSGSQEFSYWHVIPSVKSGTHAVAYRTVIGRVEKPWAHVHFSERVNGVYLNPLRPGAIGPYRDTTRPTVEAITRARDESGRIDLIAEVHDATPLEVPAPWANKPVMPALVRWRLRGLEVAGNGWRTAVDFRETIPEASLFFSTYADGTLQNHASVQGRYRVYLARGFDTRSLPDGRYTVEVAAADGHGHSALATATFAIRNGAGSV